MSSKLYNLKNSININSKPDVVWQHVTEVDISDVDHPRFFSFLGIPKPLKAVIWESKVNGRREALFSNDLSFSQRIITWDRPDLFEFTFKADPGFKVGYLFDISDGLFQMKSGSYQIVQQPTSVQLTLSSEYQLKGPLKYLAKIPTRILLGLFQKHLLGNIKQNCEAEKE